MTKTIVAASALAFALAISTPALADETPPAADIIVTGVLANDVNPINPVRLPRSARISSQVMTADDVEKRQARDVYDLLNYGTGVFTVTSGKKSPATLNIRGDSNFAFMIDGAYVPPQLSSRILQTIPADAIEEVRIVRSSTALTINPLVGISNPSGAPNNGFIVVRTKTPKQTEASIRLFGGNFSTLGANGRVGTTFRSGGMAGYVQVIGADYTTDGPQGFNLDKTYQTLGLKAGIEAGIFALDLSWLKSWSRYGIIAGNSKLATSSYLARWRFDPINSSIATANGTIHWDKHNTTLLTVAYTDSIGKFVTGTTTNPNPVPLDNNNSFLNAAIRHNLFLGDTKFQAGMDFIHWKNPTGQYYYEGFAREEKITGFFLQADQALLDGRLNLDVGGRLDRVEIVKGIDYFQAGAQPNAAKVKYLTNLKLPYAKFVSAGASLKLAGSWLVNARYAYSSQAPRPGVVLDNPAVPLKGESRNKFEIGIEGRLADWLRPSINGFYIKTSNEVTPVRYVTTATDQIAYYANTNSKRTGMEAVLAGDWGGKDRHGSYRASITHYFDVLDPSGLLARTQPGTVAELTIDQELAEWRGSGAVKYVSGYESKSFTACGCYLPLGDYVTIDLALSRRIVIGGQPVRVTASVKNLTDDNFETSIGYPSIGRQFGLELAAAF